MADRLRFGTRVRAKVRTMISGWKGTGTYLYDGFFLKDGSNTRTVFADFELARMRDQTPNPEHVALMEKLRRGQPR